MDARGVEQELKKIANREKAINLSRFFKTGKGDYGEGDRFLGISVPDIRRIAREHMQLGYDGVALLCKSKYHEVRFTGLLILVYQWKKADAKKQQEIYRCYLRQLPAINNWDLVDVTTPTIVGGYLLRHVKERKILFSYAQSKSVWKRRIAVLATAAFIRHGKFDETMIIAKKLLGDTHDLIHKAVGWMLREVGDRNKAMLKEFLRDHARKMPRTMLRYAIEHFSDPERKRFLQGKVAR